MSDQDNKFGQVTGNESYRGVRLIGESFGGADKMKQPTTNKAQQPSEKNKKASGPSDWKPKS